MRRSRSRSADVPDPSPGSVDGTFDDTPSLHLRRRFCPCSGMPQVNPRQGGRKACRSGRVPADTRTFAESGQDRGPIACGRQQAPYANGAGSSANGLGSRNISDSQAEIDPMPGCSEKSKWWGGSPARDPGLASRALGAPAAFARWLVSGGFQNQPPVSLAVFIILRILGGAIL